MTLEEFLRNFGSNLPDVSVISLGIALLAGIVASGVCPCTLPVGLGVAGLVSRASGEKSSRHGFLTAVAFFAGIVVNLTILGALAGRLGIVLTERFGKYWALSMVLLSVSAAVIAFYGPGIKTDKLAALRKPGITGSFIYGFIFSLGTSAAPLLLLLAVAATQANTFYGLILALSFGIGRGLPFLLVGLFSGAVTRFAGLSWLKGTIQIFSGLALLFVGAYYTKVFIDLL